MTCSDILTRYALLNQEIADTTSAAPLAANHIWLLAVTKQQPVGKINTLLEAGHRFFAENRVPDAAAIWPELKRTHPNAELHLIGPLQTNKVRAAVALFDVIETLDRESLVDAVEREAARIGKLQRCMIQVNIGEEPQKAGVAPDALEALFIYSQRCRHLRVEGLMCIPPADQPPAPYFACMREWQQRLGLPYLSMGMSGDYQEAIRFGATHVRIGTALMGEREQ
jgi:PLP dependent protein